MFDDLAIRAKKCRDHYESLQKNYPVYVHQWNRSKFNVMWEHSLVKGWGKPITDELLTEWLESIKYHETMLEKIAIEIMENGVFKGKVWDSLEMTKVITN